MKKLVSVLAALALAPAAYADTETASAPAPVKITINGLTADTNATCHRAWVERRRKSTAGITVWRYRQTSTWCRSGGKITYFARTRNSVVNVPCWDFQGHIAGGINWNAKWSVRPWTEGKFKWECPPLPYTRTPNLYQLIRADGYYAAWTTA